VSASREKHWSPTSKTKVLKKNRKVFLNPFKLSVMKKIITNSNAQVQETLLVSAIMALIVAFSVLFI
jgi:hypothetical protein